MKSLPHLPIVSTLRKVWQRRFSPEVQGMHVNLPSHSVTLSSSHTISPHSHHITHTLIISPALSPSHPHSHHIPHTLTVSPKLSRCHPHSHLLILSPFHHLESSDLQPPAQPHLLTPSHWPGWCGTAGRSARHTTGVATWTSAGGTKGEGRSR